MLQTIEVDGFRSLLGFRIDLHRGLNLLVGSNGSGKSNFITFLDFLTALTSRGLNSAIGLAQGAGSVFSKERFLEDSAQLRFAVSGESIGIDYRSPSDSTSHRPFNYIYDCTITYLAAIPSVFIERESLRISIGAKFEFSIDRTTSRLDRAFRTNIEITPENALHNAFAWRGEKDGGESVGSIIASYLTPEHSMLGILSLENGIIASVTQDLGRYTSVNIEPALARQPTPVESTVALKRSGEGLAGVLYRLRIGQYVSNFRNAIYRVSSTISESPDAQRRLYSNIMSWCKEVNHNIDGVQVDLDFMAARIVPQMRFRHKGDDLPILYSFDRISDGTVKWLALVTMLFVEPDLSLIEEPENFLHPFMQESFVSLCREVLADSNRSLIVSTHSPTIIDSCYPDELIMFQNSDGRSSASQVANREELRKKIQESRFGLGYFYRMGALYGTDSSNS